MNKKQVTNTQSSNYVNTVILISEQYACYEFNTEALEFLDNILLSKAHILISVYTAL